MKKLNRLLWITLALAFLTACEDAEPFTPNHNPVLQSYGILGNGAEANQVSTLYCSVYDEDGDSLVYFWSAPEGVLAGTSDTVLWLAPAQVSRYPIHCRVEDGRGGWVEVSFDVQVYPSRQSEYEWTIYNRDNSDLPSNLLWFVKVTREDVVWVLDENHDVTRFDGSTWLTWDVAQWDNGVGLDVDGLGNAWVTAASSYITKADGSTITQIPHGGSSWIVTVDNNDNVWVGGRGEDRQPRISKFDGTSWEHFDSSSTGFEIGYPIDMAFDSNNKLWTSSVLDTSGKLIHYDGLNWIAYDAPQTAWLGGLTIDQEDNIWMGTVSGDLAIFDQAEWKIIPGPSENTGPLSEIVIIDDQVWCSFEYWGVARANRTSAVYMGEGIWSPTFTPDNSVLPTRWPLYSIDADSEGNIWGTVWSAEWPTDSSNVSLFKISTASN